MGELKRGLIPPGGWHFLDRPYGAFPNKDRLIEAETEYRVENFIPVGDVEGDVGKYLCGRWPQLCSGGNRPIRAEDVPKKTKMVDRVSAWLRQWMGGGFDLTTHQVAGQRAYICGNCPAQENWAYSQCGACAKATRELALLRQVREAEGYRKLKGCSIMGWDNRTAVWQRNPPTTDKAVPGHCWLKHPPE